MTMTMPTPLNITQHTLPQTAPNTARPAYSAPRVTRRNTYALRVRGNRMRECNLFDGDVIIIRRYQQGSHQETAIATINQREVALKQLSISRLGVHLWPEDAAMPAVFLHNCDIQVLGMVMGVGHGANNTQHH
ncbi:MAG: hypothetical protein GYB28_02740 [Gammaproteobacteria bacterium]|uniref:LexA family protein n=1 Tax=Vreelandella venusta TaxID=44935 RepID=UPI00295EA30B|nr:S24 family peptidase [Halomonas venusta]MBR9923891.1 hypothetical protein [Gammaproteobacteria bacterium]MDW0358612.1 S24 family peptidase [Halomonas venusta]